MTPNIITKIAGPPGTGKTTSLLNHVDKLLESGVQPEDIVFTTFTKAGVNEAINRACARFGFPPARFHGFRTIHSLAYQNMPERGAVMATSDWIALGRSLGVSFSLRFSDEVYSSTGRTRGDYMLGLWSLGRVRLLPDLPSCFAQRRQMLDEHVDVTFAEFEHFVKSVAAYKEDYGKSDFTDMLENYLADGPDLHVPYVIVDEAQDLSPLQWAVIRKICRQAKRIIVAGDDDQCIHEWNGADPQPFMDLSASNYRVLPQSYRIPLSVHQMASKIIWRVKNRLPKEYEPRAEIGAVTRIADPFTLDMSRGSWLLLARNNASLESYANICRSKGLLFSSIAGGGVPPSMKHAIDSWFTLQHGGKISKESASDLYNWMSARNRVAWGAKTKLGEIPRGDYSYKELSEKAGLLTPLSLDWSQALDKIPPEARAYLKLVGKKEGLQGSPRITISTIHGAKGGEADNVVVMPDMTHRTFESFKRQPDPEHRVFYVAVTRAKSNLFIIQPKDIKTYPL